VAILRVLVLHSTELKAISTNPKLKITWKDVNFMEVAVKTAHVFVPPEKKELHRGTFCHEDRNRGSSFITS
jgi:intein-encoded DNA endonuclease-like protein